MSHHLELPKKHNSLLAAYEAITKKEHLANTAEALTTAYEQYFRTAVPPVSVQTPAFNKVSRVDPSIGTFVQSNTAF